MTTLNTITTKLVNSFTQQMVLIIAIAILLANCAPIFAIPITSGLILHLDASDPLNNGGGTLPSNGSSPAGWLDSSGSGNNATIKASDPNWIADGGSTFNNQPVFRFDGNDGYRTSSDIGVHGGTEATIFTVINPTGNTLDGNTRWFGNTGGGNDFFGQTHGGDTGTRPVGGTGTSTSTVFSALGPNNISLATDTHILSTVLSRTLRFMHDNGQLGTMDTTDWGAATTISANSGKGVGAFENSGNFFAHYTGDIAEVIVFDRALSDLELNSVGVYLQDKYGVDGQFANPVPEPSTGLLLMFGVAAMNWYRRRRSRLCSDLT